MGNNWHLVFTIRFPPLMVCSHGVNDLALYARCAKVVDPFVCFASLLVNGRNRLRIVFVFELVCLFLRLCYTNKVLWHIHELFEVYSKGRYEQRDILEQIKHLFIADWFRVYTHHNFHTYKVTNFIYPTPNIYIL